jgi:hypothetical protein
MELSPSFLGTACFEHHFERSQPMQVSGFSPQSGAVGTRVTIHGSKLQTVAMVQFNGIAASIEHKSHGCLIVRVPPKAGSGPIALVSADNSKITCELIFKVTKPISPRPSLIRTISQEIQDKQETKNETEVGFAPASPIKTVLSAKASPTTFKTHSKALNNNTEPPSRMVDDPFDVREKDDYIFVTQSKNNRLLEENWDLLFVPDTWWPDEETAQQRTESYDRLLQWLSTTCSGSIQTFRNACAELGLDEDGMQAKRIMRRMRLLGHIETSPDGSRWMVAPPAIVQIVYGESNRFFLSGGRDIPLIRELGKWASIEQAPMRDGSAPTSIFLDVYDEDGLLERLVDESLNPRLHMAFSVAQWFIERWPTVFEWAQMLDSLDGVSPDLFCLRRYDAGGWEPVVAAEEPGLYEFWDESDEHGPKPWEKSGARPQKCLLRLKDGTWRRGDWYGLAFVARHAQDGHCPAIYKDSTHQLAIPRVWRWPEFFERGLVLASGRLPSCRRVGSEIWLIYQGINESLLQMMQSKLDLQIERDNRK